MPVFLRIRQAGFAFVGFAVLCLLNATAKGQEIMSGSLQSFIENEIDKLPGSSGDDYYNPNPFEKAAWQDLLELVLDENYPEAASVASGLSYRLIQYTDTGSSGENVYFMLLKATGGSAYWGTYIFNPVACRKVVIQCPHPRLDSNTGKQGIQVFLASQAFAYFLPGTHRCNASSASSCSGTTAVCGSSAPYRISDVAHNDNAVFHITTSVVYDRMPDHFFIQLHGFSKQPSDPYVIMSNGSRTTPDPDKVFEISEALASLDPVLTFRIGHLDLGWNRLLAFTNTQGRYINNSSDPCMENADSGNGRFIHIEQEFSRLRAGPEEWDRMASALISTFECQPVSTSQVSTNKNSWHFEGPGHIVLDLPSPGSYSYSLYSIMGMRIESGTVHFADSINYSYPGTCILVIYRDFSLFSATVLPPFLSQ